MKAYKQCIGILCVLFALNSLAQDTPTNSQHNAPAESKADTAPLLPDGMTLEDVLRRAAQPPPPNYPDVVMDNELYSLVLIDQLEYRRTQHHGSHLGWDAQGWIGYDLDKFWWKTEGEAFFEGQDRGEGTIDLLYSRLVTPFWNVQVGAQYAYEWQGNSKHDDRWSGVLALQGLVPYKVETDASLYVSDTADVTLAIEAEYDIYISQRLVLQPRAGLHFAAQDIPDRDLGAGMTDASIDLRLRYEIRRGFAPYIGVRYMSLVGETDHIAERAGEDSENVYLITGLRLAF